ncbi:MAG: TauD/TfdA family dioxygenase [Thiofilum sp.]|uniref:TauD/TfdA family dioxygenase n=1 Tax=Thiofilum sp. TaxID=2212733 RepID=UPI0025F04B23|nr:TauD/TfdA family dioxygenase [Thiofilum sp.]MBK8452439.1 TauD/TfdA family dioxygenase [Thiofilum sp.]
MQAQYFLLENQDSYEQWRQQKLAAYPLDLTALMVTLTPNTAAYTAQIECLKQQTQRYNFALYRFAQPDQVTRYHLHQLAHALGLTDLHANLCADEDSLSAITQTQHEGQHDYIPYTNKALSWHTDGYYHPQDQVIHGMLLHCMQPAQSGGESHWLDHEIAYILLRDANPAYIKALIHPEALTIPANELKGEIIRPTSIGSVFSVHRGQLHMRYSARQRNIHWRNDPMTQEAVTYLNQLWAEDQSPYIVRHTLQAGEGLICNNILHNRNAFQDNPHQPRLLYRGRYLQRVALPQH